MRETITKPITPIIETIQNAVTGLQTSAEANVQDENEVTLTTSIPVDTEHEPIDASKDLTSEVIQETFTFHEFT